MSVNIIYQENKAKSQGLFTTIVAESGGSRWKATLYRDFYPHQSYARVLRWDGSQWQHVLDFDPANLAISQVKLSLAQKGREPWENLATADAIKMIDTSVACVG